MDGRGWESFLAIVKFHAVTESECYRFSVRGGSDFASQFADILEILILLDQRVEHQISNPLSRRIVCGRCQRVKRRKTLGQRDGDELRLRTSA